MFCPECRSEYRDGVTQCADCNVPLVRELPEPEPEVEVPTADLAELVPVLSSYDETEVLMAKSLLEAADIPYFMPGEALQDPVDNRLFPGSTFALGPARILVSPERAEEAKEILKSPPAAADETDN
jgi:hypothetical protein